MSVYVRIEDSLENIELKVDLALADFLTKFDDESTYINCDFVDLKGISSNGYIVKDKISYFHA